MRSGLSNTLTTIGRMAGHAPAAQQMLEWAGVQTRRARRRRAASRAGWLGAGLVIGTGMTLLLAPRSGAEVQRELRRGFQRTKGYVLGDRSRRTSEVARDSATAAGL